MYTIKIYFSDKEPLTIPMEYKHICVSYLLYANFLPDPCSEDKYYNDRIKAIAYIQKRRGIAC